MTKKIAFALFVAFLTIVIIYQGNVIQDQYTLIGSMAQDSHCLIPTK